MTLATPRPEAAKLMAMLRYRRPAGSKTEKAFIREFLEPLGVERDAFGNLHKRIGDAPVLWSSHTDTVHSQGGMQRLEVEGNIVKAAGASNCLGADCTTGVWLMAEMIQAGVPGLYVFHREEEMGGGGSDFIARKTPGLLAGIHYAIAFDRMGTSSIITHQAGGRCCSDAFAVSLSEGLGLGMHLDDGGTFTDTANYVDLVGECTNISVGYKNQHRATETQDIAFALSLRDALLCLDLGRLVSHRSPGEIEYRNRMPKSYGSYRPGGWMDDAWWDDAAPRLPPSPTVRSLVKEYPDEIADWLEDNGINAHDLLDEVRQRGVL